MPINKAKEGILEEASESTTKPREDDPRRYPKKSQKLKTIELEAVYQSKERTPKNNSIKLTYSLV